MDRSADPAAQRPLPQAGRARAAAVPGPGMAFLEPEGSPNLEQDLLRAEVLAVALGKTLTVVVWRPGQEPDPEAMAFNMKAPGGSAKYLLLHLDGEFRVVDFRDEAELEDMDWEGDSDPPPPDPWNLYVDVKEARVESSNRDTRLIKTVYYACEGQHPKDEAQAAEFGTGDTPSAEEGAKLGIHTATEHTARALLLAERDVQGLASMLERLTVTEPAVAFPRAAALPPSALPRVETKEAPFRCQDYRDELQDMSLVPAVFLGLDEADLLARHLGLRLPVLGREGLPTGSPRIRVLAHLGDPLAPETPSPYHLFYEHSHYCLLEPRHPLSADRDVKGILEDKSRPDPVELVETGKRPGPGPGVIRADGNCLISSLHFLATGFLPEPHAIAGLRGQVARALTDPQILDLVEDLRMNLARSPFLLETGGRLPGVGPRLTAWLKRDPGIQAALARGSDAGPGFPR